MSVTSRFFTLELVIGTVSIPYSIAGWTIILLIFPFTCGGTLLPHRTPDIFLQLFLPHGVLLFTSVFISPLLCRVLPRYLNSVTWGSWSDCMLTLANGVPFRHMCAVFALDTFTPLFSKASLHYSSSNSITYFSLAYITTSPANIIYQGAYFLMFSVSESSMMANMKGLKADPWWWPTSTAKGSLVPAAHLTIKFRMDGRCHSLVWCTSLTSPCFACTNSVLPWGLCRRGGSMLFPDQWTHGVKSCCHSLYIYCSCLNANKKHQLLLHESKLFFTYAHDVSQSIVMHSLM